MPAAYCSTPATMRMHFMALRNSTEEMVNSSIVINYTYPNIYSISSTPKMTICISITTYVMLNS